MRPRTVRDDRAVVHRIHRVASRCGKTAYSSRKRAAAAAKASTKVTGEYIEVYHCWSPCHAFHIGHPPAPFDPALQRRKTA